jgi:predicted MPP superfamily phosphohydrolase
MCLKVWESNLEESKRIAREAKEAFFNALSAVDLEMEKIDVSGIHDTLGQIEIKKNKESLKKKRENVQNNILQVNHVDL